MQLAGDQQETAVKVPVARSMTPSAVHEEADQIQALPSAPTTVQREVELQESPVSVLVDVREVPADHCELAQR